MGRNFFWRRTFPHTLDMNQRETESQFIASRCPREQFQDDLRPQRALWNVSHFRARTISSKSVETLPLATDYYSGLSGMLGDDGGVPLPDLQNLVKQKTYLKDRRFVHWATLRLQSREYQFRVQERESRTENNLPYSIQFSPGRLLRTDVNYFLKIRVVHF